MEYKNVIQAFKTESLRILWQLSKIKETNRNLELGWKNFHLSDNKSRGYSIQHSDYN